MVTLVYTGAIKKYRGLSTDPKPDASNGSDFLEIDTGDIYYFDADSGDWITPNAE